MMKYQEGKKKRNKINIGELKNLLSNGKTLKEISTFFSCSTRTVVDFMKKHEILYPQGFWKGIRPKTKYQNPLLFSKQQILDSINENKTIWEVSKSLNCSSVTVQNYIKRFNIRTEKGFYSKGLKLGRKPGFKTTEKQKKLLSEKFSGKGNPFYGKKHSSKTRKKMSKNHADFTGDKNPFKNSLKDPLKAKQHKDRCKKLWENRDGEWRKKFSEKLSKSMAKSKNFEDPVFHKNHKSGHHETLKCNKKVFYRSSWELRLCKALDLDSSVKEYKLEPFVVKYFDEKSIERYTRIDFFINNYIVIEVKPKGLLYKNELKLKALKEYCKKNNLKFFVWGIDEIKKYEQTFKFE